MKKVFGLVVLGTFAFANVASAQDIPSPIQLTPEARQGVEMIAKGLGMEIPKPKQASPASTNSEKQSVETKGTERSVADVADRALTMVEQGSKYMEEQIKNVAPEVWRIMIRQQYATAVGNPLLSVGWMLSAFFAYMILSHIWVLDSPSSDEKIFHLLLVKLAPTAVGIVAFLCFMGNMTDSVKLLYNPEFYALKDLIRVILAR